MSYISKQIPLVELTDFETEELLYVLFDLFGDAHFDEYNVSVEATSCPALLAALRPFAPKINRRYDWLAISTYQRIGRWLKANAGRAAGGLRLTRDGLGWSHVVPAGARRCAMT